MKKTKKASRRGIKCAACPNYMATTKSKDDVKVIYHLLPSEPLIRKKWLRFCKKSDSSNNVYVCSEHFEQDAYIRDLKAELLNEPPKRKLKPDAIPSKADDDDVETVDERKLRMQIKERKRFVEEIIKEYEEMEQQPEETGPLLEIETVNVDEANYDEQKFKREETGPLLEIEAVNVDDEANYYDKEDVKRPINKPPEPVGNWNALKNPLITQQNLSTFSNAFQNILTNDKYFDSRVPKSTDPNKVFNVISIDSCLVCLQINGTVSIYNTDEISELSIASKLKSFTDINITKNDSFPKTVCSNCAVAIENGYQLKMQIQHSFKLVTDMLKNNKPTVYLFCKVNNNLTTNNSGENFEKAFKKADTTIKIDDDQIEKLYSKPAEPESSISKINDIDVDKNADDHDHQIDCVYKTNNEKTPIVTEEKELNYEFDGTLYKCKKCDRTYDRRYKVTKHINCHKEEKDFICEICSHQYRTLSELNFHKLRHDSPKHKCNECDKVYYTKNILRKHLKIHKGITYPCDLCNSKFLHKHTLLRHKQSVHLGIKNYKCIVCEKEFFNSYNYKIHLRTHTGERPFACDNCDKKFGSKNYLFHHLEKTHGIINPNKKPLVKKGNTRKLGEFKCNICRKHLSSLITLKKHLGAHADARCNICNKLFRDNYFLKIHMRNHTGEKPYKCEICSLAFASSVKLRLHVIKHTGISSFQCTTCNKYFATKARLTIHIRVHTGEKPFKCSYCEKAFASSINRDVHIRVHTGEKPHHCVHCDAKFHRLKMLRLHTEKEHTLLDINNVECEIEYIDETINY